MTSATPDCFSCTVSPFTPPGDQPVSVKVPLGACRGSASVLVENTTAAPPPSPPPPPAPQLSFGIALSGGTAPGSDMNVTASVSFVPPGSPVFVCGDSCTPCARSHYAGPVVVCTLPSGSGPATVTLLILGSSASADFTYTPPPSGRIFPNLTVSGPPDTVLFGFQVRRWTELIP